MKKSKFINSIILTIPTIMIINYFTDISYLAGNTEISPGIH